MKKFGKIMSAASGACGLVVALNGTAMAGSVAIQDTGSGSVQTVTMNDSTMVSTANTNVVNVVNQTGQVSTTGAVRASNNTSVGGVSSGGASNTSSSSTVITVGTSTPSVGGQGGNTGGGPGITGGSGSQGGTSGSPTSSNSGGSATGGSVLGSSTVAGGSGSVAMLPVTGPLGTVDVAALRVAWHSPADVPAVTVAKKARPVSAAMLVVASVLSLIGAAGSLVFSRRREGRIS
jgi:hypothetical protein